MNLSNSSNNELNINTNNSIFLNNFQLQNQQHQQQQQQQQELIKAKLLNINNLNDFISVVNSQSSSNLITSNNSSQIQFSPSSNTSNSSSSSSQQLILANTLNELTKENSLNANLAINQSNLESFKTNSSSNSKKTAKCATNNSKSSTGKTASVPGKPRGATYDGNICMICSDRASGFHYGVLACEGCKGFFKRVCKEKLKSANLLSLNDSNDSLNNSSKEVLSQQNKRHCVFGGNCEINVRTRNRCQYCRIQKCIELGMSKDGIKLGRRSKKFKQNLNNVVSSINTNSISPNSVNQSKTESSSSIDTTMSNNYINSNKSNNNLIEEQSSLISNKSSNFTIDHNNNENNRNMSKKTENSNQESKTNNNNNNNNNELNKQQIFAILQDNKLIIKAIDILSAVSAVAASATSPSSANTNVNSLSSTSQLILPTNNTTNINLSQVSSQTTNDSTQNSDSLNQSSNILQQQQQQQLTTSIPTMSIVNKKDTNDIQQFKMIQVDPSSSNINRDQNQMNINTSSVSNSNNNNSNIFIISPNISAIQDQQLNNSQSLFKNSNNPNVNTNSNLNNSHPIILLNGVNLGNPATANLFNSLVILNNNNNELGLNTVTQSNSNNLINSGVSSSASSSNSSIPATHPSQSNVIMQTNETINNIKPETNKIITNSIYSMLDKTQLTNIIDNIVQAFKDTNNIYNHPITNLLVEENSIKTNDALRNVFERGLLTILNQTKFLDHINTLIENTVLFAKNVPYFMNIHETDRITLLKSSVFEILCVRHSCFYKYTQKTNINQTLANNFINNNSSPSSSIDLATLAACAIAASSSSTSSSTITFSNSLANSSSVNKNNNNNEFYSNTSDLIESKFIIPFWNVWVTSEWISEKLPQINKFIKMLFEFYYYFSSMFLNDYESALFCSYLLFNSDDPSLNDIEKLKNYQSLYYEILLNELEKSRSTINGTESQNFSKEKLITWLNNCCVKLKELNIEHAKILIEQKQYVQFPDLYAELYNL